MTTTWIHTKIPHVPSSQSFYCFLDFNNLKDTRNGLHNDKTAPPTKTAAVNFEEGSKSQETTIEDALQNAGYIKRTECAKHQCPQWNPLSISMTIASSVLVLVLVALALRARG